MLARKPACATNAARAAESKRRGGVRTPLDSIVGEPDGERFLGRSHHLIGGVLLLFVGGLWLGLLLSVRIAGPLWYVPPTLLSLLALRDLAVVFVEYRRHRGLILDAGGLRVGPPGRRECAEWVRVDGVDVDAQNLRLRSGGETLLLWPGAYRNGEQIVAAIRRQCAAVYRLDAAAERSLLGVVGYRGAGVATFPVVTGAFEAQGYRGAPVRTAVEVPDTWTHVRRWLTDRRVRVGFVITVIWISVCVAMIALSPDDSLEPLSPSEGLVLDLARGLLSVPLLVWLLWLVFMLGLRCSSWRGLLGPTLVEGPAGLWIPSSGHRRLRQTREDEHDVRAGAHFHIDELDLDGTTRATYVVDLRAVSSTASPAPVEAWTAEITALRWRARCFRGSPSSHEPYPEPRHLIAMQTSDGVQLTRLDADLGYAGDTWHESLAHATSQAEVELGLTPEWSRSTDGQPSV